MDDAAGFCRTDGQKFVPDSAMVAAEVAESAQDQEPGGEYRRLQAEVLSDFLLQGEVGQIHIDVGHVTKGQNLQNHPRRRIWLVVCGLEMFDEILFGATVLLVDDADQGIEPVDALVVDRICDPEDIPRLFCHEVAQRTADGHLYLFYLAE